MHKMIKYNQDKKGVVNVKKTLLGILLALVVIGVSFIDFGEIAERIFVIDKEELVKDCPIMVDGKLVRLGMAEESLLDTLGAPCDTLLSEYGFYWNIYHENFKNYIQVGVKDGIVVGMYTNSPELLFEDVEHGTEKEKIHSLFGEPLNGIVKGDTRYLSNGSDDSADFDSYKVRGAYVTFFYDTHKNNSLVSVNIIDCDIEESFKMLYAPPSDELKISFETQNFYVTNAMRQNMGLAPFERNSELDKLALSHSLDMAQNNYFSHTSQNGDTVVDRSQRYDIHYQKLGENLAMGSQNSIYMHELLMNSDGHRKNLLADFTNIGVGVAFSSDNKPYLTQNFSK